MFLRVCVGMETHPHQVDPGKGTSGASVELETQEESRGDVGVQESPEGNVHLLQLDHSMELQDLLRLPDTSWRHQDVFGAPQKRKDSLKEPPDVPPGTILKVQLKLRTVISAGGPSGGYLRTVISAGERSVGDLRTVVTAGERSGGDLSSTSHREGKLLSASTGD